MRDVYTARVAGTAPELFDCPPENIPALEEEASCFETSDRLARILTVLDDAAIEMRNASDPRLVLEIALTRLSRPESDLTLEALAERLDMLEAKLSCGSFAAPTASSSVQNREQKTVPQAAAPANRQASNAAAPWNNSTPAPQPALTQTAPKAASAPQERSGFSVPTTPAPQPASSASQSAAQPAHKAPPAPAPALGRPAPKSAPQQSTVAKVAKRAVADAPKTPAVEDQSDLQRKWNEVVKRVTAQKAARGALLLHARAQSDDGSRLAIELPAGSVFAMKMLQRADSHEAIVPVVCEVFGSRTVEYVMPGAPAPQPQPGAGAPQPTPSQQDFAPASAPAPEVFERPVPPVAGSAAPAAEPAAPAAEPAAPAAVASRSPFQPPASSAAHAVPATPAPVSQPIAPAVAPATETVAPSAAPTSDADERAPWESEQVPYDDAMIGEADAEEPPFQEPASDPAVSPFAVPTPASVSAESAPSPQVDGASISVPAAEPVRSTPAPSSPFSTSPFGNVMEQNLTPQTVEEGKDLLNSVFGEGVVFKPVDN